jgi:hypothetical protein
MLRFLRRLRFKGREVFLWEGERVCVWFERGYVVL